jgi:acetyl-CoA carboxylase carboxyl transferase subunit alpha
LGVVDEIVPEPEGGAHRDPDLAAANLGTALRQNLERLSAHSIEDLLRDRYDKFRKLGKFTEEVAAVSTPLAEA